MKKYIFVKDGTYGGAAFKWKVWTLLDKYCDGTYLYFYLGEMSLFKTILHIQPDIPHYGVLAITSMEPVPNQFIYVFDTPPSLETLLLL